MKDVVLKISSEFSGCSLTSHFELWTVSRLSHIEADGWKNREYLLTEAAGNYEVVFVPASGARSWCL